MKLGLTEKQYKNLLTLIAEQADAPAAEPEKGTSDKQSGGQGYPSVGKWESGITRGPANQIGVTKWADVVGSKLTRSKGNQLKEQIVAPSDSFERWDEEAAKKKRDEAEENARVDEFNSKYYVLDTVPGYNQTNTIVVPKIVGNNQTTVKFFDNNSDTKLNSHFYDPSLSSKILEFIDKNENWCVPTHIEINDMFPEGTVKTFTVNGIQYTIWIRLSKEDIIKKHRNWQYMGYRDFNETPYKQELYVTLKDIPTTLLYKEKGWWQKFGNGILMTAQFISFLVFPETIGIWVALGFDALMVINSAIEEDNIGVIIGIICAFLPFIGDGLGIGVVTSSQARRITSAIKDCKTEEELLRVINESKRLTQSDKYILQRIIKEDPQKIGKLLDKSMFEKVNELRNARTVQSENQLEELYGSVKNLYESGKIDKVKAINFFKRFGLQKGLWYLTTLGGLGVLQANLKVLEQTWAIEKGDYSQTEQYKLGKRIKDLMETTMMVYNEMNQDEMIEFNGKVEPIIDKYQSLSQKEITDTLYQKITIAQIGLSVLRENRNNKNANFDDVANKQYQFEVQNYKKIQKEKE